ncbi:MAG: YraN family protein [Ilumatobacteraceae bacterium]|nr:YraN family protein [Ilumatobacteraceae bacterium]
MGMGHVPQDSPRAQGARAEFQRPQHRRAASQHDLVRQAQGRAAARQARARFAEDLVAAWYVRNGYQIIVRNWRCPRGELDVVAWHDGVLVVCEVKARRTTNFGHPFEAITPLKMQRLRRATAAFVAARPSPLPRVSEIRFDAASVIGARVEVRTGVA